MVSEEAKEPIEEAKEETPLPERPRIPLSKALDLIPPASALRAREKKLREKRIRIRYDDSLDREKAKINPALAKELGITDLLELVVAGRHRFVFRAVIDESVEDNRVHVNPELMEENGVADGSIATVRAYRGTEQLGVRLSV